MSVLFIMFIMFTEVVSHDFAQTKILVYTVFL